MSLYRAARLWLIYAWEAKLGPKRSGLVLTLGLALVVAAVLDGVHVARALRVVPHVGELVPWALNNALFVRHGWTNLYLYWVSPLGRVTSLDVAIWWRARGRARWLRGMGLALVAWTLGYTVVLEALAVAAALPWARVTGGWSGFLPAFARTWQPDLPIEAWQRASPGLTLVGVGLLLWGGWLFLGLVVFVVTSLTDRPWLGFLAGWLLNISGLVAAEGSRLAAWSHALFFWAPDPTPVLPRAARVLLLWLGGNAGLGLVAAFLLRARESPPQIPWRAWRRSLRQAVADVGLFLRGLAARRYLALVWTVHAVYAFGQASRYRGAGTSGEVFLEVYGGPAAGASHILTLAFWLFQHLSLLGWLSRWWAPGGRPYLRGLLQRMGRGRGLGHWALAHGLASGFFVAGGLASGLLGMALALGRLDFLTSGPPGLAGALWAWVLTSLYTAWLGLGLSWLALRTGRAEGGLLVAVGLALASWLLGLLEPVPWLRALLPPTHTVLLREATSPGLAASAGYLAFLWAVTFVGWLWDGQRADLI